MANISINDRQAEVARNQSLAELLATLPNDSDQPFAVALNGEFVPRSQYGKVTLSEGDQLDIVTPVGGG